MTDTLDTATANQLERTRQLERAASRSFDRFDAVCNTLTQYHTPQGMFERFHTDQHEKESLGIEDWGPGVDDPAQPDGTVFSVTNARYHQMRREFSESKTDPHWVEEYVCTTATTHSRAYPNDPWDWKYGWNVEDGVLRVGYQDNFMSCRIIDVETEEETENEVVVQGPEVYGGSRLPRPVIENSTDPLQSGRDEEVGPIDESISISDLDPQAKIVFIQKVEKRANELKEELSKRLPEQTET